MTLAIEQTDSYRYFRELYQQDPQQAEKQIIIAALRGSSLVDKEKVSSIVDLLEAASKTSPSALTALRTMIQNQYPQLGKEIDFVWKKVSQENEL